MSAFFMGNSDRLRRLEVPADRFADPVRKRDLCAESELSFRARHVEAPSGLPVGLRRIPLDATCESALRRDQFSERLDGVLLAAAEVHRVRTIVALGRED